MGAGGVILKRGRNDQQCKPKRSERCLGLDAVHGQAVHGQVPGPQTVRNGPPLPQQRLVNEAITHLIHLDPS